MKKRFEELTMDVQYFTANEYCAACGNNVKIGCNGYNGFWSLYEDTDENGEFDRNIDKRLVQNFNVIGHSHSSVDPSKLKPGFVVFLRDAEKAWIWQDENKGWHASKIGDGSNVTFDKSTLERAKS